MEIHLIFTKNNKLKFSILNNQYRHGDFKICFSLVYSIQEIDGGIISKKVGRNEPCPCGSGKKYKQCHGA